MPAGAALGILSIEFLVHAWDFAQATGQRVVVSDERRPARPRRGPPDHQSRGPAGGSFADPIEAGPDAGILDRLVAFTGRILHLSTGEIRSCQNAPLTPRAHRTGWICQTTDQDAAKAFYAGLFGWTYDDQPMAEGPVYSMAMLGGHQVAAIAPQSPEMAAAGAPPMWNTYLATDSVDDAVARVEAAGGKVAMAPFDIMDAGRMAFVLDPAGAAVALWQANQHIGATLVNEPGTVTWNELITTDPGVVTFYADVVGLTTVHPWTWATVRTPCSRRAGRWWAARSRRRCPACPTTGTCTSPSPTRTPPRPRPPNWAGRSWSAPFDTPVGRMAVLSDPQGAVFSIIKTAPPPA